MILRIIDPSNRFSTIPIHVIIFFLVDVISNRKSRFDVSRKKRIGKNSEDGYSKGKDCGRNKTVSIEFRWNCHRFLAMARGDCWAKRRFHVGWRDDLKFKARAARVVRSLTEYHDRCHGSQSSQLLRGLANFSPFFPGNGSPFVARCCTRGSDSSP